MPADRVTVEVEDPMRDWSRVDAWQLRLRAWRGSEYVQFFTVNVPGVDLALHVSNEGSDFQQRYWDWLAALSLSDIDRALDRGDAPLRNQIDAYEIQPRVREAARRARQQREVKPVVRASSGRRVVDRNVL